MAAISRLLIRYHKLPRRTVYERISNNNLLLEILIMTMTQTEPRTVSPSGAILNRLQEMQGPLLEQVRKIKADDRLSPSAKSADIAGLVGGHDAMLDNVIEDAQHDAEVALTSAGNTQGGEG